MKVYRTPEEPKFEPVTIVLETEDEARTMWIALNQPSLTLSKHEGVNKIVARHVAQDHWKLSVDMWAAYNEAYRPKEV